MLKEKDINGVLVRQVPGFVSFWVSNSGSVWSDARIAFSMKGVRRHLKGKWLKPVQANKHSNYRFYRLQEDGRSEKILLHRLVALAWIGPPPFEGAKVLHADDNPDNNHVSNLRWGTHTDNMRDRQINGREFFHSVSDEALLRRIYLRTKTERSCDIARDLGVSRITVMNIKNKISWKQLTDKFDLESAGRD